MNIERSIKLALETGKVYFGRNQAIKMARSGEARLVIRASNAVGEDDFGSVPVLPFKGTGEELGSLCGKPFSITHITVVEAGRSDILRM